MRYECPKIQSISLYGQSFLSYSQLYDKSIVWPLNDL